jgi:3,4-dihydroxy 2-butanone 4-phosphate synthase/GTP cyclohydrolase II
MTNSIRIAKGARRRTSFASIDEAVAAFRDGQMIIVCDDEDRENEGDLTIAAEKVTPAAINFMAKYGRGQICLSMTGARLDELEIPLAGQLQYHDVRHRVLRAHRSERRRAPASPPPIERRR